MLLVLLIAKLWLWIPNMTSYISPFTNQTISPSQVGYESLSISVDTYLEWPVNGNTNSVVANIIEVTATVAGLSLIMPPATAVSVGQATIIRNVGTNSFTVKDNSLGTIISISSGIAEYIYVTNNTTTAGVWSIVTFGAGTSSANASSLAGYGLTPIGTTLNQAYNYSATFSARTLSAADRASFIVWDAGVGTVTLPSSSVGNNWFVMIRNNGSGILTIACQGTDLVDGSASIQLQLTQSIVIVCSGTGFNSFGSSLPSQFNFTILSKLVTGGTVTLTATEGQNSIQEYYGTLTSNCIVVLPSTVQLYSLQNNTTGAYTLTFKTTAVGASVYTLPQGQTGIVICDGTNVYSSTTALPSVLTALTLGNGSQAAPSLNFTGDTTTGLYLPSAGTLGITSGGVKTATFASTGVVFPTGVGGGTF
jgi:hypothetical protein